MRTHYLFGMILCIGLLAPASARADLKYFPDPAYKRLNADDPPPMSEMIDLANQGDTRAMFILGDMSEKGKGGLEKDVKQARSWFEESAMHGYSQSFIRLAAMAKHDKNPKEAWQWYTLAISGFDDGDAQDYAIRARKELVEKAKLAPDDIDAARKAMNDWKDARDKHLRDEKDAAAEKERQQKEQAEKDSKAQKEGAADSSVTVKAAQAAQDKKPDQQENNDE
jgi:TPR repeat protein